MTVSQSEIFCFRPTEVYVTKIDCGYYYLYLPLLYIRFMTFDLDINIRHILYFIHSIYSISSE